MAGAPPDRPHPSDLPLSLVQKNASGAPELVISPMSLVSPKSTPVSPVSITPDGMDCFGSERQVLWDTAKFYNNPTLSDVKLKIGNKLYHAHKLILVRSSEVFEKMLTSSEWEDAAKVEVGLVEENECVRVFPHFLKYLYSCHIVLNCDQTLPILVLADKYNVTDLRKVCINFACLHIIPKLQLKDVFHVWFQYATKCYHQDLITACVNTLAEKMDDVINSVEWEPEWFGLDKDQLIEFLKSSELRIKDEFDIWQAVVKWIYSPLYPQRQKSTDRLLRELLPHIRFPMISADQICEIERQHIFELYPHHFTQFILQSYKYHALSLTSKASNKDYTTTPYLLRNYSELRWDKRLHVMNYQACNRCSEVSLRFTTRSCTVPSQAWEWELKVYPKGYSSASEDFRCILYSNLILDQPRPMEFILSIVDGKRVLCTVSGKKNFSKNRYTVDTEIDKKITVAELSLDGSAYLIGSNLTMQMILKPVE